MGDTCNYIWHTHMQCGIQVDLAIGQVVFVTVVMWFAGAHGVCGILLTLMQCYPELEEVYPGQASSLLADSVAGLLGQTLPSGNLLSSLGSEHDK